MGNLRRSQLGNFTRSLTTVNTGAEQRDQHLRGDDFFGTDKFPEAHFTLTEFRKDGDEAIAKGELTIRGVRKPISLKGEVNGPAKDPWGNQRMSAALEAKISRKEWGLVWNSRRWRQVDSWSATMSSSR